MTVHYDVLVLTEQIVWIGHVERSRVVYAMVNFTVPAIGVPSAEDTTIGTNRSVTSQRAIRP
jgi:hypothetical protein